MNKTWHVDGVDETASLGQVLTSPGRAAPQRGARPPQLFFHRYSEESTNYRWMELSTQTSTTLFSFTRWITMWMMMMMMIFASSPRNVCVDDLFSARQHRVTELSPKRWVSIDSFPLFSVVVFFFVFISDSFRQIVWSYNFNRRAKRENHSWCSHLNFRKSVAYWSQDGESTSKRDLPSNDAVIDARKSKVWRLEQNEKTSTSSSDSRRRFAGQPVPASPF